MCRDVGLRGDPAKVKEVHGVDEHPRIEIGVGLGEQITHIVLADIHSCLFLNLPLHGMLSCLTAVCKTSDKVKCAFGGFLCTGGDQKFVTLIHYQSHHSTCRVEIIDKSTIKATFRLEIIDLEMGRPAYRTVVEFLQ